MKYDYDPVPTKSFITSGTKTEIVIQPVTNFEKNDGSSLGKRHGQMFIYSILLFLTLSMSVNISICIVAMTDPTASINEDIPTYNWTDKSIILSAFFWGYMLPQIAAGWLVTKYGPKWFLVGAMTLCSLFGYLLPIMAESLGSKGVMGCRFMQGVCLSVVYPSVHALLGKWVPPNERSRMATFVYAGSPAGVVVSMFVSGYIAASWYGWPMVFYFYSTIGLMWSLTFSYFGSNGPAEHSTISNEERNYIQSGLKQGEDDGTFRTPWRKILTSIKVWALITTSFGYSWGYFTLLSEIPIYLKSVMKFDMESNSLISCLPYLLKLILAYFFSFVADKLINKKICSIGTTRKLMNGIGMVLPAIALLWLGNTGKDEVKLVIVLLIVAVGISSAGLSGFLVNHMDLSPNHSGTLMGIDNQFSLLSSALGPLSVQFLVPDEENADQWKFVFYSTSIIYVVVTIIFCVFGSGSIQPWNNAEEDRYQEKEKEDAVL
ncbi:unnamed protein product [Phaedon cochleariae]|uniref:Putative inorganic phosphate cotransporter n=1 Tax=Phaedon cochleariae TaxID=80249 RepID=A0A9P0DFM3_PHACE|nr:unnamed protein product [Phaedon cochleariae]